VTTYAPVRLLEVRHFMKPITGLTDAELGITPDPAHDGGYHCGWDDRRIVDDALDDYAWEESPRDWNHKTNAARAFDLGMFARLREFSIWLVAQCEANRRDPNVNKYCADIREVIYSPDGRIVLRWDRLSRRTSGDSSHLKHTHISYFADAEDRDKTGPYRRFFGMEQRDPLVVTTNAAGRTIGDVFGDLSNLRDALIGAGVAVPGTPAGAWPKPDSPLGILSRLPELLEQFIVPVPVPVEVNYAQLAEALRPIVAQESEAAVRRVMLDASTP
jgi:hypothetical protein